MITFDHVRLAENPSVTNGLDSPIDNQEQAVDVGLTLLPNATELQPTLSLNALVVLPQNQADAILPVAETPASGQVLASASSEATPVSTTEISTTTSSPDVKPEGVVQAAMSATPPLETTPVLQAPETAVGPVAATPIVETSTVQIPDTTPAQTTQTTEQSTTATQTKSSTPVTDNSTPNTPALPASSELGPLLPVNESTTASLIATILTTVAPSTDSKDAQATVDKAAEKSDTPVKTVNPADNVADKMIQDSLFANTPSSPYTSEERHRTEEAENDWRNNGDEGSVTSASGKVDFKAISSLWSAVSMANASGGETRDSAGQVSKLSSLLSASYSALATMFQSFPDKAPDEFWTFWDQMRSLQANIVDAMSDASDNQSKRETLPPDTEGNSTADHSGKAGFSTTPRVGINRQAGQDFSLPSVLASSKAGMDSGGFSVATGDRSSAGFTR